MLTWLRLYNSPERVTSSRVGIPGLFFSLSFAPFLFFSFYLKGGVTGLGAGGCSYCGTFVRVPVAEAGPAGDLRQHLQDAKPPLYAFNHTKSPGRIGERTELV